MKRFTAPELAQPEGVWRLLLATALCGFAVSLTGNAFARSGGAPFEGCYGCHGDPVNPPGLELTLDSPVLMPGQTVIATLTISDPNMQRAGFFAKAPGTLQTIAGQDTKLAGTDLTHSRPLTVSGGEAQVSFSWTLPSVVGGGAVEIFALAANGDGRSQGDSPGNTQFPFAWGCDMVLLYRDLDRDGVGNESQGISGGCDERDGWARVDGDCDENNDNVNPLATEVCNEIDDNCDGEVDEGTEPRPLFPDADGDGYGVPSEEPIMGCLPPEGYAEVDTDCDDDDPLNFPDNEETCDGQDNNCNARADEEVQARCGTGWCERLAPSCNSDQCYPGEPRAEECNAFDDDCDGVVDNDASGCPEGEVCYVGRCLLPEDAAALAALDDGGMSLMPEPDTDPGSSTADSKGSEPEPTGPAPADPQAPADPGTTATPTPGFTGDPEPGNPPTTTMGGQASANPQAGDPGMQLAGNGPTAGSDADPSDSGGCNMTTPSGSGSPIPTHVLGPLVLLGVSVNVRRRQLHRRQRS